MHNILTEARLQITLAPRTWLFVLLVGSLGGFAIVGAEAVFLRTLPTTNHLLVAVAVGILVTGLSVLAAVHRLARQLGATTTEPHR